MYLLALVGLFIDRNDRFTYRFTILQLVKHLPPLRVLKVFLVARPGVGTLTKGPKDSGYENGLLATVSVIIPARELEFTSLDAENVKRFVLISSSCFTYLETTVGFMYMGRSKTCFRSLEPHHRNGVKCKHAQ